MWSRPICTSLRSSIFKKTFIYLAILFEVCDMCTPQHQRVISLHYGQHIYKEIDEELNLQNIVLQKFSLFMH